MSCWTTTRLSLRRSASLHNRPAAYLSSSDGGADTAAAVIVYGYRGYPYTSRYAVAPRPRRGRPSVPLRPLGLEALTRWDQGTSLGVGGAPRTDETGPVGGEPVDPEGADTPGARGL